MAGALALLVAAGLKAGLFCYIVFQVNCKYKTVDSKFVQGHWALNRKVVYTMGEYCGLNQTEATSHAVWTQSQVSSSHRPWPS